MPARAAPVRIQLHLLPRRLILACLLLAGLGLRLWGLAWGPGEAGSLHPGEWTWQIIDKLSWSHPTHPGIWTQAFFSLAALVKGAVSLLMGWWEVLLGQARTLAEVGLSARLAGRLTVALMGGAQVLMAYLVGRRFFDSVATGLLAAALVAVSPLLVTQAHYLSLDVPLGLAVLGCLWAVWIMSESPRLEVMILSGLILGLATTTRASGLLMLLPLAAAYYLGVRRVEPAPSRKWLIWPFGFILGLALGLVLGYPGFVLTSDTTGELLRSSLTFPPVHPEKWLDFMFQRLQGWGRVLGTSVGLDLVLLWLVGVSILARRRLWRRLLLVSVPLLYILAGTTLLKGSQQGLAAVWLPVVALVAAWPVVLLCRRLPGYWTPALVAAGLGLVLCTWPLWRSLGVGYIFWQEDTYTSARRWVESNLPPGAPLLVEPGTPLGVFMPARPWRPSGDRETKGDIYLALSSLARPASEPPWRSWPANRHPALQLPERLQLVKRFDLKAGWRAGFKGASGFPRWVSPRVDIYAALPPLAVRQPLALFHPPVNEEQGSGLVYTRPGQYSRCQAVMRLGPGAQSQRVLVAGGALDQIEVVLTNLGEGMAEVVVSQGPWSSRRVSLYPGQQAQMIFAARAWPPMMDSCYPLRVRLLAGGSLLAHLLWDPALQGRRALEAGRLERSARRLERALGQGGGLDVRAMLAVALARLGRFTRAREVLARPVPARAYQELATAGQTDLLWQARFGRLTGYHYGLLRRATSLTYRPGAMACRDRESTVPLRGPGYHGSYTPSRGEQGGGLKLWLTSSFPTGGLQAELRLKTRSKGYGPSQELGKVELWGHDHTGSRLLAQRVVRGRDLAAGRGTVVLPFVNSREGTRLELRLDQLSPYALELETLVVGVDLRAHMRRMLRWYYEARGRVALQKENHRQAARAFGNLLALDPDFSPAYVPAARALLDTGRVEAAYHLVRRAEDAFRSRPAELQKVQALYKALQKKKDLARVDKRLEHLRPSLRRQARFACGLTLLGYDLSANQVKPGDKLDISYYWRCWQTPPLNYFIFVHLVGQGRRVNYDHLLDHGRRRMTRLQPGEVVREDYRVTIPSDLAPGRYRLLVGLWDPHFTGKSVVVSQGVDQGSEAVHLATLEVLK